MTAKPQFGMFVTVSYVVDFIEEVRSFPYLSLGEISGWSWLTEEGKTLKLVEDLGGWTLVGKWIEGVHGWPVKCREIEGNCLGFKSCGNGMVWLGL
jgi:hypothetical protein